MATKQAIQTLNKLTNLTDYNYMADVIFADGINVYDPNDKAPEFIKGKIMVNPVKLAEWARNNKQYLTEKGYLNLVIKRSAKTNNLYLQVDTWKPTKQTTEQVTSEPVEYPDDNINPVDIPF